MHLIGTDQAVLQFFCMQLMVKAATRVPSKRMMGSGLQGVREHEVADPSPTSVPPAAVQAVLGYLNFSTGKPDPKFQRPFAELFALASVEDPQRPWTALERRLGEQLESLHASGAPAFKDVTQARAVLRFSLREVPVAYREHHRDLLFHLSDAELFQPFFLARVCEAVLRQAGPWDEAERIVPGAVRQLNDFVGYRPVAVLENRLRGEIYEHERVRPIPLFIRGAGIAPGRYRELIEEALGVLGATDPSILQEAGFDLQLLDELALDPRAYDHGHPVNRRSNHVFGEWDPHHLDQQGRYRRFVIRHVVLDALGEYARQAVASESSPPADRLAEIRKEIGIVLAGTILMASGVTGGSPSAHDSTVTLATLVPRIARYREAFYRRWLDAISGPHGERLRAEAERMHQPFGGVRQQLNQLLARQRADQLQRRHLAILFASLGYPEESRRQAAALPAASARILCEIIVRLTTGLRLTEQAKLVQAAALLPEIEDLVRRGIQTGSLVDPWNILGFGGQFPLFAAAEDSIPDPRVDDLVRLMELVFNLYARLVGDAAAAGQHGLRSELAAGLRKLADWWDQFATWEVSGVHRVQGSAAADSAEHVAAALAQWHERGAATADLGFWREHLQTFNSPKAFALVVDALLQKNDHRAAMALLVNWLSQAHAVSLEEGEFSFYMLAVRWLLSAIPPADAKPGTPRHEVNVDWPLVRKFFDFLEANADEYWQVPTLKNAATDSTAATSDEGEDDLYEAAYEEMTYRDSTDDGQEGSVADGGGPLPDSFSLEEENEQLSLRLRFLSTLARLWQIVARQTRRWGDYSDWAECIGEWLRTAERNHAGLLDLLQSLHALEVPAPLGSYDSMIEYDKRRLLKEQVLDTAINTCLDTALAIRALQGAVPGLDSGSGGEKGSRASKHSDWEPYAVELEQALVHADAERARTLLPRFAKLVRKSPLLYVPLDAGGEPRQILRVRLTQATLRSLVEGLPRIGLLRESFQLLLIAREMEQVNPPPGRRVTEFDRLFQSALIANMEAVIDSAANWGPQGADPALVRTLEMLSRPFLGLWIEHSQSLRLSTLEGITGDAELNELRDFIRRYGNELFTVKFMTLANLRSVLHRGVGNYLDYLAENDDPRRPSRLLDDLGRKLPRAKAVAHLQLILQAVAENYEIYRDYNSTTPQSDYGENLHMLLDFLRLRASYERHVWHFRPLALAHEILARRNRGIASVLWQEAFVRLVRDRAQQHLEELARLEHKHGMKLRTVADRLEEQFVTPLAQDRLCALIEPAMEEARQDKPPVAFQRLLQELQPFIDKPAGVGFDLPQWLRRMEMEVYRVRSSRTAIAGLAEEFQKLPRVPLAFEDLQRQLQDWNKPAW